LEGKEVAVIRHSRRPFLYLVRHRLIGQNGDSVKPHLPIDRLAALAEQEARLSMEA